MTGILPASPEVILQSMVDSVKEANDAGVWDVQPIFGLVCDTPKGPLFAQLPLPKQLTTIMDPPEQLAFVASQLELTGMKPPVHPSEGWTTRGFIFMAEGWGISATDREDMEEKVKEGIPFADRPESVECRMCTAVLKTGEMLSVIWNRGDAEPGTKEIVQPDSPGAAFALGGKITMSLVRMAAVI